MPNHFIIIGLGYGDEGKGALTGWLCATEPVHTVVRFNGGAQAGHNVVTADGRHHCFSQFGSGTLEGARTHLSRFMLVDPLALAAEAEHLIDLGVPDPYRMLTVDRRALLVTPYHKAANQARERQRGSGRHGSCGKGIGETVAYRIAHPALAPVAGHCERPEMLNAMLIGLKDTLENELGKFKDVESTEAVTDAYAAFAERIRLTGDEYLAGVLRDHTVVFEGAQGVMLDEVFGFQPHVTWSRTTLTNAYKLMDEAGVSGLYRIGVTRTYTTRHGAGPLITEDDSLVFPEPHNTTDEWQGRFRVGHLDGKALRYAAAVSGGLDAVALTHMDTAAEHPELQICTGYTIDGRSLRSMPMTPEVLKQVRPVYSSPPDGDWIRAVETATGAPVKIMSHAPDADSVILLGELVSELPEYSCGHIRCEAYDGRCVLSGENG